MIYMYMIIIKDEVMNLRGSWEEWEETGEKREGWK